MACIPEGLTGRISGSIISAPGAAMRWTPPLLLPLILSAGETPPPVRDFWAGADAIDAACHLEAARAPAATAGQLPVLELTCAKAFLGHDVVLELPRAAGTWWPGRVRCPGVTWAEHAAVVEAAEFAADRFSLTVRIAFEAGPGWTNDPIVAGRMGETPGFTARLTVTGTQPDANLVGRGRFVVVVPEVERGRKPPPLPEPFARQDAACTGRWRTGPPEPAARPDWDAIGPRKAYALAVYSERLALRNYHRLRALRLARRQGRSFALVAPTLGWWDPLRPPLPGTGAAPPPRRNGGDDLDLALDAAFEQDLTPPEQAIADDSLGRIGRRIAALRRLAEATAGGDLPDPPAPAVVADPDFGPWGDAPPLPAQGARASSLPADAGVAGRPVWMQVTRWQCLTPCPVPPAGTTDPLLPDLVPEEGERYRLRPEALPEGGNLKDRGALAWQPLSAGNGWGFVAPPNLSTANRVYRNCPRTLDGRHSGIEHSRSHLVAEVQAPAAVELWAALGINQRGELWLGERLLWAGPADPDDTHVERVALVRIPFAAGANTLRLVCDVDYSSPTAWLRICVRGGPRDAATVAARDAAVAAAGPAPTRGWSGWRGDGTGLFPDATPPIAWDLRSGACVRWHTPLPYWSNATPALAADRLFVTVEPHTLVCLATGDGRIRWQQPVSLLDCLPEAERDAGWRLHDAWWAARIERDALPDTLVRRPKWLRTRWWWEDQAPIEIDERRGATPALVALLDRREALEAAPDPMAVQEELAQVLRQIEDEKQKHPPPELATERRARDAWRAWLTFMQRHCRMDDLQGYWYDYDGYAFASPITDGRHVWWKNGTGVAACFTLDGERVWLRRTDGAGSGSPTIPSPLLVADRLVLQLPDYAPDAPKARSRGVRLLALDPATGTDVWDLRGLRSSGWNASTPGLVDLTDGTERLTVIVTGGGSVVRATDGAVLIGDLGLQVADASPLVRGDLVYFSQPVAAAVKLIMVDRDTVRARRLWARREATSYAGLFAADGLVYQEARPFRDGPGECPTGLLIRDGATGARIGLLPLWRKGGNCWQVHAATRDHLLFCGGDSLFRPGQPKPPADLAVVTRGPDPLLLASNAIERSYGSPVAVGDRLYLRGYRGVACIGHRHDADRAWEARRVAATILDQLPACPLRADDPLAGVAVPGGGDKGGCPVWTVDGDGLAPPQWQFAGPFPATERPAIVAALVGGKSRPRPGDTLLDSTWRLLDWAAAGEGPCPHREIDPATGLLIDGLRRVAPLARFRGARPGAIVVLSVDLRAESEGLWRLDLDLPGAEALLGGTPVPDGGRFTLAVGHSRLTILAPADATRCSPRLWRSHDPEAERNRASTRWQKGREWLDRVRQLAPDSEEARRTAMTAALFGTP
jgi:outer membrane protein assembly factor BamB